MKLLVFDLETRKLNTDLRPDNPEEGWDALKRGEGGISCLMIWDDTEKWMSIYDDKTILAGAMHLESADLLIGFHTIGFDIPVIEGVLGRKLQIKQHYDIYAEISKANAHMGVIGRKGEFTLDAVARRAFGRGKNGHGANITVLLKEQRYGELFNYCANDVRLTRDLFEYIRENNGIPSTNNRFLTLAVPDWLKQPVEDKC